MKKCLLSLAVLTVLSGALTGCKSVPEPENPVVVERNLTLDRVMVRDDSTLYLAETRGGAAFREPETAEVLFNGHHESVEKTASSQVLIAKMNEEEERAAKQLEALRNAMTTASATTGTGGVQNSVTENKAEDGAGAGTASSSSDSKKEMKARNASKKTGKALKKDTSVYTKKDRSIYQKKQNK